jgi:hypothetical protein
MSTMCRLQEYDRHMSSREAALCDDRGRRKEGDAIALEGVIRFSVTLLDRVSEYLKTLVQMP